MFSILSVFIPIHQAQLHLLFALLTVWHHQSMCAEFTHKHAYFFSRFTDSETFTETFLLKVRVLTPQRSLLELGSVPLVVPAFYSLSNDIDSSVLTFRTRPSVICSVRLLSSEINVPTLGQVVTEDPAKQDQPSEPNTGPRKGSTVTSDFHSFTVMYKSLNATNQSS